MFSASQSCLCDRQVTYDSVIGRLADIETELNTFTSCKARLPAAAATDKAVRDAASDAEKALEKFFIELSMRKDIFDKVRRWCSSHTFSMIIHSAGRVGLPNCYLLCEMVCYLFIHSVSYFALYSYPDP